MEPTSEAVAYLFYHVVLPPQLPQGDDRNYGHERTLMDLTLNSLRHMKTGVSEEHHSAIDAAIGTIDNLLRCRDEHGYVDAENLGDLLQELVASPTDRSVPLHITAQNAAILISRCADNITFEFFELTPTNEAAMAKGRLIRKFPGFAAAISVDKMKQQNLRQSLASTIAKLATQIAEVYQPNTTRNSPHPGLVTDYLLNVIAAVGEPTDVVRILKHTREEVLRRDSKQPWRRSSLWLLVRVTLQLLFTRMRRNLKISNELYKIFMAVILEHILRLVSKYWSNFGSEPVKFVSDKLVGRLQKLEVLNSSIFTESEWADGIRASIQSAHDFIESKWTTIQEKTAANIDTTVLRDLRPDNDIDADLPCLNDFLRKINLRTPNQPCPASGPTSIFPAYSASKIPGSLGIFDKSMYYRLAAVEKWVEKHLQDWVEVHHEDPETCGKLFQLIKDYHSAASTAYAGIPISLSVMYLTILEVWVSSDSLACFEYPLLKEYAPEICLDEFQGLCLPLKHQMERLYEVEAHVRTRHTKAVKNHPSVYREFGHPLSFAVKYFDQTPALQMLHAEILRISTVERQKKREELVTTQALYAKYMAGYKQSACEYEHITIANTGEPYTVKRHVKTCANCAKKKRASALSITVHEWPLDDDLSIAKATIFELRIPKSFSDWRDMSYYFKADVLKFRIAVPERSRLGVTIWTLGSHDQLWHSLVAHSHNQRIMIQSDKRPATGTTKKGVSELEVGQVCVKNTLKYRYYDVVDKVYTGELKTREEMTQQLLYRMPNRSKCLERFIYKPPAAPDGPSSNEPIASLTDCPSHLSVDEFKAFGITPLGCSIIYTNILTQLAMPSLDFAKAETQSLILQTIHQVGPRNEHIERVTHSILTEVLFGSTMLDLLETSLRHKSENWESWRSAATFSLLARRIMSLTSSPEITGRCHEFLQSVRQICIDWLGRIQQRIASSAEEEQRTDLHLKSTEVALLCVNTFDVEETEFDRVLKEPSAVPVLMQCSIKVRESLGSMKTAPEGLHDILIQAWRSLMYRLFPKLMEHVSAHSQVLDRAISSSWAAFKSTPGVSWHSLGGNRSNWFHTVSGTLDVYLNLLTAELLIDGNSLTRLPAEFTQNSVYSRLFNKYLIEIGPTNIPGLSYSAKSTYRGFEVHFGKGSEDDLLIVALHGSSRYDLLPSRIFKDYMPQDFVTEYIHWFDHAKKKVLFCPRDAPWPSAAQIWHLTHKENPPSWRMIKGNHILIDRTSESARVLSGLFQALEDEKHVHITLETASQTVSIELPRLQLGFYVGQIGGRIYSRQYRGMILDSDQNAGSLFGLSSKLVLRSEKMAEDRMILVPTLRIFSRETVTYSKVPNLHCVQVSIVKDNATKVYAYTLDATLGREIHDQSIQSQLVLSLLHALTSHCLPDPLTRKCGIEAAISILQSAALRSFEMLSEENILLLNFIGSLSVTRTYVPQDENGMQEVVWNPGLYIGSQNFQLRKAVQCIFHQAQATSIFYPESISVPDIGNLPWRQSHPDLEEREAIRQSRFQVAGYGADNFTAANDLTYASREQDVDSERARRAFVACRLIIREEAALHTAVPDLRSAMLRAHFDYQTVAGCTGPFNDTLLHYDKVWLEPASPLLRDHWCGLHKYLVSSSAKRNPFTIMMWLATMAYSEDAEMLSIQSLAAFFRLHDLGTIKIPEAAVFNLSAGRTWNLKVIQDIVQCNAKDITECPEGKIPRQPHETNQEHSQRTRSLFVDSQASASLKLIAYLKDKYPTPSTIQSVEINRYFHLANLMQNVTEKFRLWNSNRRFYEYLGRVSKIMARLAVISIPTPCFIAVPPVSNHFIDGGARYFNTSYIFKADAPIISNDSLFVHESSLPQRPAEPDIPIEEQIAKSGESHMQKDLKSLCRLLDPIAKSTYEKGYVKALRKSCDALQTYSASSKTRKCQIDDNTNAVLQQYLGACEAYLATLTTALSQVATQETGFSNGIASYISHAPRISPTFWLSFLRREHFETLSAAWKDIIIEYGLSITHLYRARRLVSLSDKPVELAEQLQLTGHSNWNVSEFPETLLLEAENGIMIRPVQEVIASEMRNPADKNAVMQLNMGSGKSSVILPMVAAALTDSVNLVRVIVARPQSKQMLEMLVAKLGGLLNRRILHMPFARCLKLGTTEAEKILQMCKDCIAEKGILLIQPEHILSLRLMAIEHTILNTEAAKSIVKLQQFLYGHSRDIVDESDDQFDCKLELIYTMGFQQPVDLAPNRWLIIMDVLSLVAQFCYTVKDKLPLAMEVLSGGRGTFPKVRILRRDGADELLALLSTHLVQHGLPAFPTRNQSPVMQKCIEKYISEPQLDREDIKVVEESPFWSDLTKDTLLLLRGLIAGGLLRHALGSKRWRVNYGTDGNRIPSTSLAVPYRYKDGPSARAEFSHPDLLILLSLLSHYYAGLSDEQLFDAFIHLLKSDQAAIEYDAWVRTADPDMPEAFRNLSGVNIKDRTLCIQQLFPYVRFSKSCIDFFLSRLVFPKEVRQFEQKISTSAWNLGANLHPTTGFSGTSDTQHLLPLAIKHLDLPSQRHTNALVLGHILSSSQLHNLPPRPQGVNDATHLLMEVTQMRPEVRVILDCGAQILEQNNRQVVETWLKMSSRVQAAVFFHEEELAILDRAGHIEPFQTSPFSRQLDVCIVYLDEAHTRGTDLKLPRNYRAAVTLGAGLTKDRLMQACMRMRQLGHGQEVTFIISEEISTKIRVRASKPEELEIEIEDLLCWTIGESWQDLKKAMPIWSAQGSRYLTHEHLMRDAAPTKEEAATFLENEAQTIEDRYRPRPFNKDPMAQFCDWDKSNADIQEIIKRCKYFNILGFASGDLDEEEERELAPEKEEERQVERPARMKANQQHMHPDVERLAKTGKLSKTSRAIIPAFQALRSTSVGKLHDLPELPTDLLVTNDFMRTILVPGEAFENPFVTDTFQRPVQWVISVPGKTGSIANLVVISPFEANNLLPSIRKHLKVTLHTFAPHTIANFKPLDKLDLWTVGRNFKPSSVSRSLTMQLNLFAGSLYLRSYEEYIELCDMLGLLRTNAQEGQVALLDGFITTSKGKWGLRSSPVPVLRALLLKIRREGEGLEKTHLGKILTGVRLEEADFNVDVHMTG